MLHNFLSLLSWNGKLTRLESLYLMALVPVLLIVLWSYYTVIGEDLVFGLLAFISVLVIFYIINIAGIKRYRALGISPHKFVLIALLLKFGIDLSTYLISGVNGYKDLDFNVLGIAYLMGGYMFFAFLVFLGTFVKEANK